MGAHMVAAHTTDSTSIAHYTFPIKMFGDIILWFWSCHIISKQRVSYRSL
jgi:uncharacterized membrane protein